MLSVVRCPNVLTSDYYVNNQPVPTNRDFVLLYTNPKKESQKLTKPQYTKHLNCAHFWPLLV